MANRADFADNYIVEVGPYALNKESYHIVYWQTDSAYGSGCFSLAIFERRTEGYELRFVGDRPFEYGWSEQISFMDFAHKCQKYMDGLFCIEEMKNEQNSHS